VSADEDSLAVAAEAGIHRLAIPTPFQVGRINAYLIEDSPLTLVDSGPNSAKALDELEQALAARGHAIEDIELLVITHQHIDHFGLASILARRSGAEVAALDRIAPFLARYGEQAELDDRFAEQLMLRHGIASRVGELPRLGLGRGDLKTAHRRRGAASARSHVARAPSPGTQPVGHGVPG
jgi:glyoxylase-like metal-dependent hydrolase (beta-lactamase superfamily II)